MSAEPKPREPFLRASAARLRALWSVRFHWPAVWVLCALALALVFAVDLLPQRIFAVTMSIDATSEVVELELDPRREYVWTMPAGAYSLVQAPSAAGCTKAADFELACAYADPTSLVIRNGPIARLEVVAQASGAPHLALSLTPRGDASPATRSASDTKTGPARRASSEVRGPNDELLAATSDYLGFESSAVDRWRIPVTVTHVQLGESLHDNVISSDESGSREPILTGGNVRVFARRAFSTSNRYQVQDERFDPADVVQLPEPRESGVLLLGILSLNAAQNGFEVTLHTDGTGILVRRLGAEHAIGASMWSIVSKDPAMLALWASLIALLGLTNYHSTRLNNRLARQAAANAATDD